MDTVKLRQDRAALVTEMGTLLDFSVTGNEARWQELDAKQKNLHTQIEAIERTSALNTELDAVRNADRPNVGNASANDPAAQRAARLDSPEYRTMFGSFLSGKATKEELRTYTGMADSVDGVLIPTGFQRELEIKLKAYGDMRRVCRVIPTATGNPLPWPVMDDTANAGSWLAEAGAVNQTNPSFSNIQLGANMLSSDQVLISVQLLQDSAFSMESELVEAFGIRLGRGANAGYVNGTGAGQPKGLIPALTAAGGRTVTLVGANPNSGNVADTDINSVGSDDWDNLIAAIDPAYRAGAMYIANQATFDVARHAKDKYGRPLWQVSLAVGVPDTINGYPYDYNQAFPVLGANAVGSIVFGNFKKYIIRDVLGMTVVRYNELYMPNHQIGFEAFLRTDGQLLQPAAFSMSLCNAS